MPYHSPAKDGIMFRKLFVCFNGDYIGNIGVLEGARMPIDEHLLRDERILASARASSGGILYATNKRVIRYERGFFRENVDSLHYSHIVGASLESQSYIWLVVIGILLFIGGVSLLSYVPTLGSISAILLLFGIVLAAVGFLYRPAWYQIKAAGLDSTSGLRWRTTTTDTEAKTFARFIEDQISMREIPTPSAREREVITKEVVMIKCSYCGALMPQTATFCPNCGAKRR